MPYFPPQQTALDILNKIKTVDGSGSGLDADTIDGLHANELSTVAALNDLTDVIITSPSSNQLLQYNGTNWVNVTVSLGGGVTDHGALAGLSDNDHPQYYLASNVSTDAQNFLSAINSNLTYNNNTNRLTVTGGLVTPGIRPASNGTSALGWFDASGTQFVYGDTMNRRLGIGTVPSEALHTSGNLRIDGAFVYLNGNLFANANGSTDIILGSNLGRNFYFRTASGANRLAMLAASGYVGVGLNPIPTTQFDCQDTNSSTSAIQNAITMRSTNAGTPGEGFGIGFRVGLKSSTTADQSAGRLTWEWIVATHASRASRCKLSAYAIVTSTETEQEAIRWDGNSAGIRLGFYGVSAVARQTVPTGSSIDDVITALQNLGLFKQS